MIDRVHFEKFKSLENVTLDLGRLTALVGPNGSGKSSVLQGLDLLRRHGLPDEADQARGQARVEVAVDADPALSIAATRDNGYFSIVMLSSNGREVRLWGSAPSAGDHGVATVSPGRRAASSFAWMTGAAPEARGAFASDLARLVPGARAVRADRVGCVEVDFEGAGWTPAALLSDGTLLAMGLLAKLHDPGRPRLLLLDDIERGLHIETQAALVLGRWKYGTQTGELWAALGESWVTTEAA